MLIALLRALAAPFSPALRRLGWRPFDRLVDSLGMLAVFALSRLLFPAVVTTVIRFFLERIAATLEAVYYPGQGPPRRASISETIVTTIRLMGLTIILNCWHCPYMCWYRA